MPSFVEEVKLFIDGGCRGNPGPGAIGILILGHEGNELHTYSQCIVSTTNNRAEYQALIKGLNLCAQFTRRRVICFSDSQLLINQMNGLWRLKNEELCGLFLEVKRMETMFADVVYQHVGRENPNIRKADRILNEAFEGRQGSVSRGDHDSITGGEGGIRTSPPPL
jgi:ribonuclease HI